MEKEVKSAAFILVVLLSFYFGALVVTLEIFPFGLIQNSLFAAKSIRKALDIDNYAHEVRWTDKAPDRMGVIRKTAQMWSGYTLYVSTHDTTARLIDADGNVIHTWNADYDHIWSNQDHLVSLFHLDNSYFFLRDFYLYPDGSLIVLVHAAGITPWGVGLAKLDKDSHVIWKYDGFVNNDFEVAENGNIYTIEHNIRHTPIEGISAVISPFLEDNIVTLGPDGHFIKAISLISAFEKSDYKSFIKTLDDHGTGDPTHLNSVKEVHEDVLGVPWLKKGYLLLSIRNVSAMAVLDPKTEKIVYAANLRTRMQHDLELLKNGDMLVFDDRGDFISGGITRVLEFKPLTQEIVWSYESRNPRRPFESKFWGAEQRLPNGDTMIVDAEAGRLVEVNTAGETVWEYRVPLTKTYKGSTYIATITQAERLTLDRVKFLESKGNRGKR